MGLGLNRKNHESNMAGIALKHKSLGQRPYVDGKNHGKNHPDMRIFWIRMLKKKAIDRIYNYNQLHIISQQYINLVGG